MEQSVIEARHIVIQVDLPLNVLFRVQLLSKKELVQGFHCSSAIEVACVHIAVRCQAYDQVLGEETLYFFR